MLPDFANAYSALDGYWTPTASFSQLLAFLREAGEDPNPGAVYAALIEMQRQGSVLAVHAWGRIPRYALISRLKFRRALPPVPPRTTPWAS